MSSGLVPHVRSAVARTLRADGLVSPGSRVLVAVSGGPDSMALIAVLRDLAPGLRLHLDIAHLDHGIRDTAIDRTAVLDAAERWKLAVHVGVRDVPAIVARRRVSLEAAARAARYAFLEYVADRIGATHIATGHTRDDQVETVLMRIMRGAGLRGLGGIPIRRGQIVRPLLSISRRETVGYCRARRIPYVIDPTNQDPRHLRNRVRQHILPQLRERHPGTLEEQLLVTAGRAARRTEDIRERTRGLVDRHFRHTADGEWTIDTTPFSQLDDASLVMAIADGLAKHGSLDRDVARVHYGHLVRLIRDPGTSGQQIHLPGLVARREHDALILSRKTPVRWTAAPPAEQTLDLPGETNDGSVVVRVDITDAAHRGPQTWRADACRACFDADALHPPLVMRRPLAGDRMQPHGMAGTKKLSDIFIDRKIPARERLRARVVSDRLGIVWLVGVTTSERTRIGPQTRRVVRIHLLGASDGTSPGSAGAATPTTPSGAPS